MTQTKIAAGTVVSLHLQVTVQWLTIRWAVRNDVDMCLDFCGVAFQMLAQWNTTVAVKAVLFTSFLEFNSNDIGGALSICSVCSHDDNYASSNVLTNPLSLMVEWFNRWCYTFDLYRMTLLSWVILSCYVCVCCHCHSSDWSSVDNLIKIQIVYILFLVLAWWFAGLCTV